MQAGLQKFNYEHASMDRASNYGLETTSFNSAKEACVNVLVVVDGGAEFVTRVTAALI
tara:strand:- start:687 stop:860 length:174 start_codon:yes stop_codon:yes gene_type:complete